MNIGYGIWTYSSYGLRAKIRDVLARAPRSPRTANIFTLPRMPSIPSLFLTVSKQGISYKVPCGCHRGTSRLMIIWILTLALSISHRGWMAVNVQPRLQLPRYGDLSFKRGAAQHSVGRYLACL